MLECTLTSDRYYCRDPKLDVLEISYLFNDDKPGGGNSRNFVYTCIETAL